MPVIHLPNGGEYKYRTIPLYPGVKQINKEVAEKNLQELKRFFNKHSISFQLAAGTLLGAVRENDFIDHDEDIDIALLEDEREKFLSLLPSLYDLGFELCRFDRRDLYSLMRNGEYIDLYFFHDYPNYPGLSICSGWIVKTEYLTESVSIFFQGESYLIPKDYESYLFVEYGADWRIPRVWNNYNQPKIKILLFNLKEYLKDWLPDHLFRLLAKNSEQAMIEKSLRHISRLKEI